MQNDLNLLLEKIKPIDSYENFLQIFLSKQPENDSEFTLSFRKVNKLFYF
jgi:hypothetical protein